MRFPSDYLTPTESEATLLRLPALLHGTLAGTLLRFPLSGSTACVEIPTPCRL